MGSDWFSLLTYITILSPILPLIFLFFLKHNLPTFIRNILIATLLSSLISDVISVVLGYNKVNNHPVIHIYTIIVGVLWLYLYSRIIKKKWMRSVFLVLTIGFIATGFIETVIFQQYFSANRFAYAYLSVALVVFSLTYFFLRIDIIQTRKEIFDYLFWINCAILIYFGSTFVITIFEDLIQGTTLETFYPLWTIQLISNILFNLIIAKGIWIAKRT